MEEDTCNQHLGEISLLHVYQREVDATAEVRGRADVCISYYMQWKWINNYLPILHILLLLPQYH